MVSHEKLPQIISSLNGVANTCKLVANCCIGVGTLLIAVKAIQGARKYLHHRHVRWVICSKAYTFFLRCWLTWMCNPFVQCWQQRACQVLLDSKQLVYLQEEAGS